MVNNLIGFGQALYGSRVLGEPKNSANVSREVNVETRDPANREMVGVGNDDLESRNGGGVPERRMKMDGFVGWASSVNGFRAFVLAKHSSDERVNREIHVESGISGVKNTSLGSEIATNNDGVVSGVKVDEGEDNADGIYMGGEKGNEGAFDGDIEVFTGRMGETEERRTSDEKNVTRAIECVGNDGTGYDVVVNLNAQQNRAGDQHLSGRGIGGEGIAVEETLNESNVSSYGGGVNNAAASFNKGVGPNENQDAIPKEAAARVNLEGMDGTVIMDSEIHGEECRKEKVGEYYPSDLVWGKVISHPWWPGQIFEPSAASKKALKHKKEGHLIAYFGDQTFAWNKATTIKPFHKHFTEMEKQSDLEAFSRAVGCALDEVSRRVEFGLSCSCLPEEQLAKIDFQIVVNGGINEEASIRYSGDKHSSASAFLPAQLLRDFKSLAASPTKSEIDRLTFVIVRAQLVAFNRWKDLYELPEFIELDGEASCEKAQLGIQDSSSNISATEAKRNCGRKRGSLSSCMKHKATESVPSDSKWKRRRVLSPNMEKESPSTPILKSCQKSFQSASNDDDQKLVDENFPPPKEMLSKLCLAALNPKEGYKSLYPCISFFSTFRNSVSLENKRNARKRKISGEEHKKGETSSTFDSVETFDAEDTEERDVGVLGSEEEIPVVSVDDNSEEHSPTVLSLKFGDTETVPSLMNLIKKFSRYGPLNESQTEVSRKSKRAKVVFKRSSDAETAFSSAEESNMFGPSLVCYHLKPLRVKTPTVTKRDKKAAKSA